VRNLRGGQRRALGPARIRACGTEAHCSGKHAREVTILHHGQLAVLIGEANGKLVPRLGKDGGCAKELHGTGTEPPQGFKRDCAECISRAFTVGKVVLALVGLPKARGEAQVADEFAQNFRRLVMASLHKTAEPVAAKSVSKVVVLDVVAEEACPARAEGGERAHSHAEAARVMTDCSCKQGEGTHGTALSHMLLGRLEMVLRRDRTRTAGNRRVNSARLAAAKALRTWVGN
jgi:hypothetical protein